MSGLKQELGLLQGIGLLSTSLLGTGIFAIPALAAVIAGQGALWVWPLLIALVFPVAIGFAALGRHYPHAGGAAHFVEQAFGKRMGRATAWLFLSVIPAGLPAALQIAAGFWQAAFGWGAGLAMLVQLATLLLILGLGLRSAGSSANVQTLIALLIICLVLVIAYAGRLWQTPSLPQWPAALTLGQALAVMFWCFVGIEAFAHLGSEFRQPERDFPRALLCGLLVAGSIYWLCTLAVLHFSAYGSQLPASASIPSIVGGLFGLRAQRIACLIGYLACFASINIYLQSFARLIWAQAAQWRPSSRLARLSRRQVPANALTLVVGLCALSALALQGVGVSLSELIIYANGIFVLIYLLSMLAGVVLLQGWVRWSALLGAGLCVLMLLAIGWHSGYALAMLALLYALACYCQRRSERSLIQAG